MTKLQLRLERILYEKSYYTEFRKKACTILKINSNLESGDNLQELERRWEVSIQLQLAFDTPTNGTPKSRKIRRLWMFVVISNCRNETNLGMTKRVSTESTKTFCQEQRSRSKGMQRREHSHKTIYSDLVGTSRWTRSQFSPLRRTDINRSLISASVQYLCCQKL